MAEGIPPLSEAPTLESSHCLALKELMNSSGAKETHEASCETKPACLCCEQSASD